MVGRFFCRIRHSISNHIESDCVDNTSCIAVSPKCGKGLSSAVRTGWKSISCICKSWNTIRREASIMMKTYANYRKNRRLVQYFFKIKKFAV